MTFVDELRVMAFMCQCGSSRNSLIVLPLFRSAQDNTPCKIIHLVVPIASACRRSLIPADFMKLGYKKSVNQFPIVCSLELVK